MESVYEECFKNSPIAYAYHKFLIDSEGNPYDYIFLDVNKAFEQITGFKKENVIGKKVTEVMPNIKKDNFDWIEFYGKVVLGKERHEIIQYSKALNHWYKIIAFSPKQGHFLTMFYDISKERQMIEALQEKQETIYNIYRRHEILFKNSLNPIVFFDKNNIVLDVNKAFLKTFKYNREECIGKNLDDLIIVKDKRKEVEKRTIELFNEGKIDLEAIRYTKYEEAIYVKIKGILLKEDNNILGGYVIYTDITEKVVYQKALENTNEELQATIGQLTASEEELRAQYDEIQLHLEKKEELRQKYEIAIKATNSFVWELDHKFKLTRHISESIEDLLGIKLVTKSLFEVIDKVVYEEDKEKIVKEFYNYKEGFKDEINSQIRIKDKNGRIRWYLVKGRGIKDKDNNTRSTNGVLVEISDMKKKEGYIKFLAEHDPLTGLYNRRKFSEIFLNELEKRKKGALLLVDIDNFKNINDTMGHVYGDKLLREISKNLNKIKNENIIMSRFGGDEFLILIKDIEDKKKIKDSTKIILNNFREKIILDDIENFITVSIGIVRYPYDGQDIDDLLKKADISMYKAKETGKNKYMIFNEEMGIIFNERIEIENILKKAIMEEGFVLNYQPIINTCTGEVCSFEALIRLKNVNIPPIKFITIAEETELILPIGRWVIKEAIRQIKTWQEKGLNIKPIAINLSPRQFYDKSLIKYLKKTFEEYKVDSSFLEIEITENVLVENKEETIEKLEQLKKLGISISLDDFGTGYSSLNYLTFIPINKIKLDKSLKDKFLKLKNMQIIDSLISIAHGLNMKVVAEGIEEIEEYKLLKEAKCDYLQGYLFNRPANKKEVEKILSKNYYSLLLEE